MSFPENCPSFQRKTLKRLSHTIFLGCDWNHWFCHSTKIFTLCKVKELSCFAFKELNKTHVVLAPWSSQASKNLHIGYFAHPRRSQRLADIEKKISTELFVVAIFSNKPCKIWDATLAASASPPCQQGASLHTWAETSQVWPAGSSRERGWGGHCFSLAYKLWHIPSGPDTLIYTSSHINFTLMEILCLFLLGGITESQEGRIICSRWILNTSPVLWPVGSRVSAFGVGRGITTQVFTM